MAIPTGTIIYFIVEILFYFFHVSVLILLIARRNSAFKGPFYTILRTVFFVDLLWFLLMIVVQKVTLIPAFIPFFKGSIIAASFCFNLSSYISAMQFLGNLLMAFNRFTLIYFPIKHYSIWKRRWYMFLIIFSPFLNIVWRIDKPVIFDYLSDTSVTVTIPIPSLMALTSLTFTSVYLSTTLFAAIFNVLSFIKFYFHKQTASNINVNEKNLLSMSFVIMIAQILRSSYNLSRLVFPSDAGITLFYNAALLPLGDIFALSGSVSLLVLSATTRKEYKNFYYCKNYSLPTMIAAKTSSQKANTTIHTTTEQQPPLPPIS